MAMRRQTSEFESGRITFQGEGQHLAPIVFGGINCHLIDINDKASDISKLVMRRIVKEKMSYL
jgi:hypothetical protein